MRVLDAADPAIQEARLLTHPERLLVAALLIDALDEEPDPARAAESLVGRIGFDAIDRAEIVHLVRDRHMLWAAARRSGAFTAPTIRQLAGNLVIVPNSRFADAILTNYHQPEQDLSVTVQAGVGYESDLDQVEKVTIDVAQEVMAEVDGGVGDHEPSVRFHTFGESRIDFSVTLRTREFTDQYVLVHEFIKRLHRRYQIEGIEIPSPKRTVVMADASTGT